MTKDTHDDFAAFFDRQSRRIYLRTPQRDELGEPGHCDHGLDHATALRLRDELNDALLWRVRRDVSPIRSLVSKLCAHIRKPYTLEEICEQVDGNEYNSELMLQHLLLWVSNNAVDSSELLTAVARKHYKPIGNPQGCDGAQMWDGQWWMPKWGCDTLDHIIEDLASAIKLRC